MALLNGLRRIFTHPKSPILVETLGPADLVPMPAPPARQQLTDEPPALTMTTPRPRAMPEPARRADDVATIAQKISDHLEAQSRRSQRSLELIEKLPGMLDTLPEMNRQNTRLLDVLGEHLDQARKREGSLASTLGRITETAGHQAEVLSHVQEQLDANRQVTARVAESLTSVRSGLNELTETNRRLTSSLDSMRTGASQREIELLESVQRMHHWMIAAVACAAFSSLIALAVLMMILF
jgi:hypothetical protein